MVGHQVLVLSIGVRIPALEQTQYVFRETDSRQKRTKTNKETFHFEMFFCFDFIPLTNNHLCDNLKCRAIITNNINNIKRKGEK